jgi:hypothetical protein
VREGEHAGLLRLKVAKSPLVSYTIIANPKHTMSVCSVGDDDVGEEDAEGNVLHVAEYLDEATGTLHRDGFFTVPADAYRDKITLEWIFAQKNTESETDRLFNDLVAERHGQIAATGGISGLKRVTVEQTGYANFGDEEELAVHLKHQSEEADVTLQAMSEYYGQEKLEKMKPSDFYRLYKDFSLGRQ